MPFRLDPRIGEGSALIGETGLCQARLQLDRRWPWIVMVPQVVEASEFTDLAPADRTRLMEEVARAMAAVRALGEQTGRPVGKLNLGALGNVVPQLHWHVVGRRSDDPAWPGPVWGVAEPLSYAAADLAAATALAREVLLQEALAS